MLKVEGSGLQDQLLKCDWMFAASAHSASLMSAAPVCLDLNHDGIRDEKSQTKRSEGKNYH